MAANKAKEEKKNSSDDDLSVLPLPAHHSQFSSKQYWDIFFMNRNQKAFEWYGDYYQLEKYIDPPLRLLESTRSGESSSSRILVIGCGNSNFSLRLYEQGFQHIVNIDFSDVVISEMKLKCAEKYSSMQWELMDMTKMTAYSNEIFDVIIDKGSLDALMSIDDASTLQQANNMFSEIERVLSTTHGIYICISLCQDYILKALLEYFSVGNFNFKLDVFLLEEMRTSPLIPFVFIISRTSTATMNTCCVYFDSLGNSLSAPLEVTSEELRFKIAAIQEYHDKRHALLEFKIDRFEVLDFDLDTQQVRAQDSLANSSIPPYSIIVYDFTPQAKRLCAAFFVPIGRETDYQFAMPNGLKEIAIQAECCRLLVIRCNRPHTFPPMAELQLQLSPLLTSLKPNLQTASGSVDDFPFLALEVENCWNSIHMGTASLIGDYCIEECEEETPTTTTSTATTNATATSGIIRVRRRLIFLQNQGLIQTEVVLESGRPKKKNKSKNKSKNKPTDNNVILGSNNDTSTNVFEFCHDYLDDHHRAFLAALTCSSTVLKNAHNGVRAAVIGLGGGALVMALQKYIPSVVMDVVELVPEMESIAAQYFGFKYADNSSTTRVLVMDGLDYLTQQYQEQTKKKQPDETVTKDHQTTINKEAVSYYDILIIDVDCKDIELGITAPPPAFVTLDILRIMHTLLSPQEGMLLLNVATRTESYIEQIVSTLKGIFCPTCNNNDNSGKIFQIRPSTESANTIIIAVKGEGGESINIINSSSPVVEGVVVIQEDKEVDRAAVIVEERQKRLVKWLKSVNDEGDVLDLASLLPFMTNIL